MYNKYKHFFWLFFIIGLFLSIFLAINEYFSNQIFLQRYDIEMRQCLTDENICNIELLKQTEKNLDANQKKLVELHELISHHVFFYWNILRIFMIFILIGVSPFIFVWTKQKLLRFKS